MGVIYSEWTNHFNMPPKHKFLSRHGGRQTVASENPQRDCLIDEYDEFGNEGSAKKATSDLSTQRTSDLFEPSKLERVLSLHECSLS